MKKTVNYSLRFLAEPSQE